MSAVSHAKRRRHRADVPPEGPHCLCRVSARFTVAACKREIAHKKPQCTIRGRVLRGLPFHLWLQKRTSRTALTSAFKELRFLSQSLTEWVAGHSGPAATGQPPKLSLWIQTRAEAHGGSQLGSKHDNKHDSDDHNHTTTMTTTRTRTRTRTRRSRGRRKRRTKRRRREEEEEQQQQQQQRKTSKRRRAALAARESRALKTCLAIST